jgi:hypothetical protein
MRIVVLISLLYVSKAMAFSSMISQRASFTQLSASSQETSRRNFVKSASMVLTASSIISPLAPSAFASDGDFNVDDFLKSGQVAMPMGVSGQAGKSRPETGVLFRDGSEPARDPRTGNVLAEILLNDKESNDLTAVLVTFSSPWPIATGSVFDLECRDAKTGDGAFLSLSDEANGKSIQDLSDSFFLNKLFSPTGRFAFYGPPTDVKVKKSYMSGDSRFIEFSFSILSQSTGAEIPRNGIVVASIPSGSDQAVMLVGSSSSSRWRKGSEEDIRKTTESFKAVPSPKTGMKVRAKIKD